MCGIYHLSLNKILLLSILFSIYTINESRFVWDFGTYCINYCGKIKFKIDSIGICSCHWISSNHRRSLPNTMTFINNNQPFKLKTLFIK